MPPQREIIAAVTTSVSETATSAGWGTQIEEAEAEKKKQKENTPSTQGGESEDNARNEKQRKKVKRQTQKRKAEDNARIEQENVVKRKIQQSELEDAKVRQEQIAKEHGNELETTLNDEKKCSPQACASQTNAEMEAAKEATQKSKNCENTRINLQGEEKCGPQKCADQTAMKQDHTIRGYGQERKVSSPPTWVMRCLAPWIDSWSRNGRISASSDQKFTTQKSIIVDSDKMVTSEIFAEYGK